MGEASLYHNGDRRSDEDCVRPWGVRMGWPIESKNIADSYYFMDRQTFLTELDNILELPAGTLQGPEKLEDLENWNSMAIVSFIALVDENFNLALSPRQFGNCETVDDLLALVKPLGANA